MQSAL